MDGAVEVPPTTLIRELPDGESVILDMESEKYFGLDGTATAMWTALTSTGSIAEAYQRLLEEFDVEEGRLREDLLSFIDQLVGRGLIRVRSG